MTYGAPPLPLFFHPDYAPPLPPGHRFPMSKYALLLPALAARGQRVANFDPELMPVEWLHAVHDPAYVDAVLAAAVPPDVERRIGLPVTPAVARRTRLVAGGTHAAGLHALAHGWAANGAGGSHHAGPDGGAGYCVTNDLAIAANRLVAEGQARCILIVDCDVHQGDGTAHIMAGRCDIITLSIHAEKNFPVRKARSTHDIGLSDGTGDADYLAALEPALSALLPEVLIGVGAARFAAIAERVLTPKTQPVVGLDHLYLPLVSVAEESRHVVQALRRSKSLSFRHLVSDADNTLVVVARFLALLDLYRQGVLRFNQVIALGELQISWTGSDSGDVEVSDEFDIPVVLDESDESSENV